MENIVLDPHNYRIHDDNNKSLINKSLSECGAGRSILLDNDDVIIAGNGVYEQAQELGLKVRIVESDGSELIAIKRTDLSTQDEKRKLLSLADNATSDTSYFDFSAIIDDIPMDNICDWGISIPDFTIDENQLNDFFSNEHNPQSSKTKSLICPHCGKNIYEYENTSDNAQ